MLKIKDNVDLKELEKYGFVKCNFGYEKEIDMEDYTITIKIEKEFEEAIMYIQNDYYDCDYTCLIPSVIYDLIKDDLVEKVD